MSNIFSPVRRLGRCKGISRPVDEKEFKIGEVFGDFRDEKAQFTVITT
jgi:hypothetical protein